MKSKHFVFALLLTVLSIVTISIAVKSCQLTPKPNRKEIHEIIIKKSDSVAVAASVQPDTAKLRKLSQLKYRIAKARFDDSLQRLQNQRR